MKHSNDESAAPPSGTSAPDGFKDLQRFAQDTQRARVSRRTLLRASSAHAVGTLAGAAVATAASSPSFPDGNPVFAQGLAPRTALVVSLRLPQPGIGLSQVAPLLSGEIANWSELGAGLSLPVTTFAIDGLPPEGGSHVVVPDYDALAEALDQTPGGVAMVPLELIDPRVSVLEIDGVSPLLALSTPDAPIIRIGIAGDIIFGRKGGEKQIEFDDWLLPAYQVKDVLSNFDVTVANFECFVSDSIDLSTVDNLDFVTRPDSLQGMVMTGVDSVTMANNHAVFSFAGYGIPGMQETMAHLTGAGITPWGVGMDLDEARAPWVTEVHGVTIAFYGVDGVTANLEVPNAAGVQGDNPNIRTRVPADARSDRGGTNPLKLDLNLRDIENLAGQYDIVLPYFHMGDQYRWTPREWVVNVSRQCIDAGATAVLSAHPHATMGMEVYHGKPIFYSIGNFIYDQMFSLETREGYLLELMIHRTSCIGYRIHPVETVDFVQPRFLSPLERVGFNDRFWRSVDLTRREIGFDPALTRP